MEKITVVTLSLAILFFSNCKSPNQAMQQDNKSVVQSLDDPSKLPTRPNNQAQANQNAKYTFRPDSLVKQKLSKQVLDALSNIDSIEAFWLDANTVDTSSQGFNRYKVIEKKNKITTVQADTLLKTLAKSHTYLPFEATKRCAETPVLGFRIWTGSKKKEDMLITLECDLISFRPINSIEANNIDNAHDIFKKLLSDIFPNSIVSIHNR